MRLWIDIENPPQVQYLLPFKSAFERAGHDVVVTARDYGITFELLAAAGAEFIPVGASYGKGKARKLLGLAGRARALSACFPRGARPAGLVHSGRAAPLVARRLSIPAFSISDYEYVDVTFDRLTRTYVLFPDVIDAGAFAARGIRADRLLPFRGLKEDISLEGIDARGVQAHEFPGIDDALVRVLVRPAAEESHYYRSASGEATRAVLEHIAPRRDAVVVYAPRYPSQVAVLEELSWANDPLPLAEAVPFVSLLKAVDLVVSSGGTMAREAAYLGVPSYTAFQGEAGGVDRHLASLGRLTFLGSPPALERLRLEKARGLEPLAGNPQLLDELTELVLTRAQRAPSRARGAPASAA